MSELFKEPRLPRFEGVQTPRVIVRVLIDLPGGLFWAISPANSNGRDWTLPGGGVDGLPLHEAALREVKEELGITVELTGFIMDAHEPGRCPSCRRMVELNLLPADHMGCYRRYYLAKPLDPYERSEIGDKDEIGEADTFALHIGPIMLTDPLDKCALVIACGWMGEL